MKKYITIFMAIIVVLVLGGCGSKQTEYDIKITIPAGSTEAFGKVVESGVSGTTDKEDLKH